MPLCAFVGDELTALGFRLGGIECHSPSPEETPSLFRDLQGRVELILLTAQAAEALPADLLRKTQAAGLPLVLVIADVRRCLAPPDPGELVRRQLGMAE